MMVQLIKNIQEIMILNLEINCAIVLVKLFNQGRINSPHHVMRGKILMIIKSLRSNKYLDDYEY